VRLGEEETREAAAFLGLDEAAFSLRYLEPGVPPWDIGLDESGYCLFHQPDGLCLIHPVKPAVCRQWPFLARQGFALDPCPTGCKV
jgi:Fe-S-cluster containining protein